MPSVAKITPFFWYADKAEEAARFYVSIFPNSSVDKVTGMNADSPSGPPGSVKVVSFTLCGAPFTAMSAGGAQPFNNAISLSVACDDQAEVDKYWDALLEGGKPQACGWLLDRYGLAWQITPRRLTELMADPDPARARRTAEAMMKMIKIDIATLEKAAAGK